MAFLLEHLGDVQPDIAAANNDDMIEAALVTVEDRGETFGMRVEHGDIGAVSGLQDITSARGADFGAPADPDDPCREVRKHAAHLVDRKVDQRIVGAEFEAQQLELAARESRAHDRARRAEALEDGVPHFRFGRDDHVDGQAFAREDVLPGRIEVRSVAHARDLERHREHRVGDLADHHVDFIEVGDRDNHLAVRRPRPLQNVRMRRMANNAAHVEVDRDLIDQIGVLVDDGNFVLLARESPGNTLPHASGAADQNVHQFSLSARVSAIVPHARCYAQSL